MEKMESQLKNRDDCRSIGCGSMTSQLAEHHHWLSHSSNTCETEFAESKMTLKQARHPIRWGQVRQWWLAWKFSFQHPEPGRTGVAWLLLWGCREKSPRNDIIPPTGGQCSMRIRRKRRGTTSGQDGGRVI